MQEILLGKALYTQKAKRKQSLLESNDRIVFKITSVSITIQKATDQNWSSKLSLKNVYLKMVPCNQQDKIRAIVEVMHLEIELC